ncbi:MAG: hypothetical protein J7493_09890 [Porphyrobacter sp.]|nr:hypothetical protein [Porphyrobacter sp.]
MTEPNDDAIVSTLTVAQLRKLIEAACNSISADELQKMIGHKCCSTATSESPKNIAAEFRFNEVRDRLNFQLGLAQSTLRNLMLVNGGALVALLTFIGNSDSYDRTGIFKASNCFSIGLGLVLTAYFAAFWSQLAHGKDALEKARNELAGQGNADGRAPGLEDSEISGKHRQRLATLLAVLSLVAFVAGSYLAMHAIT